MITTPGHYVYQKYHSLNDTITRCQKTTDNRYWNSPARMSDGRLFTSYISQANQTRDIARRYGVVPGTDSLNHLAFTRGKEVIDTQKREQFVETQSGDPYGTQFHKPPFRHTMNITPQGKTQEIQRDLTTGVGLEWSNTYSNRPLTGSSVPSTNLSTPASICVGEADLTNPYWGLDSPDMLIFNQRPATPRGGSTIAWLTRTGAYSIPSRH
jgi:hypothetical protein